MTSWDTAAMPAWQSLSFQQRYVLALVAGCPGDVPLSEVQREALRQCREQYIRAQQLEDRMQGLQVGSREHAHYVAKQQRLFSDSELARWQADSMVLICKDSEARRNK